MAIQSPTLTLLNEERRRFDETKAGVKGLVDGGIKKVPPMFVHPPESLCGIHAPPGLDIPTIDLAGVGDNDPVRRQKIVEKISDASSTWGIFRVINHGIPMSTVDEMLDGTRKFHELGVETKARYYTRDSVEGLAYCSNFHLYRLPEAEWRDTFSCDVAPDPPRAADLPAACGEIMMSYKDWVMGLGRRLFCLIAEGLGVEANRLLDMACDEGLAVIGHYYPACPEPDRTLGIRKHSDNNFLTILAQDGLGGLQVEYEERWVDVEPVRGSLVVNIGNILQIISNDKMKSVEHRVVSKNVGPRVSVACFFSTGRKHSTRVYGPIEELVSEENPARYPGITIHDYFKCYLENGSNGIATLRHLRL
ncbi:1-aminocyclopropane-1-carboxylate oxidase homolog 1-like isoform X2 [Andrographis paniculata]|uniref:1-aminocyclopropane-1-carboxylate oxidase homolog 1-like isoform X2 n=1 Tax=Andrographis paniculata TaxID=175694 RepID=UPI0021E7E9D9|nr:1-aminocyclopropane-1-carboxylate oxidase homolog 1-like isoform X2 [Andrographis paniculata]